MNKLYFTFSILFSVLLVSTVFGQAGLSPIGAKFVGMGNATVAMKDPYSLFYNPAGISDSEEYTALFAYENRYGLNLLHSIAAGIISPLKFGTLGLNVHRFGDQLYNEQLLGLTYANTISGVSLGLKTNWVQMNTLNTSTFQTFTFEFGAITELTSTLSMGARVYNFTQSKFNSSTGEQIPLQINLGLSYKSGDNLLVNVEVEKEMNGQAQVRAGADYKIKPFLSIRTGISTLSSIFYGGIGLNLKKFQFDYSINSHQQLGLSNQLSVVYKLSGSKN